MIYKLNGSGVMAWQYMGANEMEDIPSWVEYLFGKDALYFDEVEGFKTLCLYAEVVRVGEYIIRLANNSVVVLSKEQFRTLFVESEDLIIDDMSINFEGKLSDDIHSELLKLPAECYLNVYHKMQSKITGGFYNGCGGV